MQPVEYIPDELEMMLNEFYVTINRDENKLTFDDISTLTYDEIFEKLKETAIAAYTKLEVDTVNFYNDVITQYETEENPKLQEVNSKDNVLRNIEKDILLRVVDNKWIDHLHNIDMLRDGIGLRAYGQKDPLIEYKREAYDLFNNMMCEIQSETIKYLFRTRFGVQIVQQTPNDEQ
ncbi:MAG: hypothetical protein L6V95_01675 [Candidatus Melainabacteria bacterium]|nr:MAG: hypothetical protein L6V95_01675 [Candidatus Melainabacteria bacterium]